MEGQLEEVMIVQESGRVGMRGEESPAVLPSDLGGSYFDTHRAEAVGHSNFMVDTFNTEALRHYEEMLGSLERSQEESKKDTLR